MPHSEISPLERFAVVQDCTALIMRFAERSDARDAEALAAMFTEDGVFARPTLPDKPYVGRAAILEGFRARPVTLLTRHIVTNVIVTPVSANEATAESYILLYTAQQAEGAALPVPANPKQLIGNFRDAIMREAGVWKFKERRGSLAMSVE